MFSENGKQFMDNSLIQCAISLNEASKGIFYQHFIAAYFELAEIAFSRTLSRELRYEAMNISAQYLNERRISHLNDLIKTYNSAFGSSFEDGIKPMARVITQAISPTNSSECEKYLYGVFYGILEAFFKDLKGIKIVSGK